MDASVIIPTRNRRTWALQAVSALLRQDHRPDAYEIIVCCDRCTDETAEALQALSDKRLQVISSPGAGKAGALNAGLRLARGRLAIFLDDEAEAEKNFVSAHLQAHQTASIGKLAIVGYSQVVLNSRSAPFTRELAKQYEEFFEALDRRQMSPEQSTPLDLCGSNFSIPVSALHETGAFNEALGFPRDDFELAIRLLQRGYQFRFHRAASAKMNIALKRADIMSRAVDRAKIDCALARIYPTCVPYLPFYRNVRDPDRRWRARILWITGKAQRALSTAAGTLAPSSIRLMHWDYAVRYYACLQEEIGNWDELCRICESREVDESSLFPHKGDKL
jgi:glycosyltransferase involved in cell wall biosynthesis